MDMNSSAYHFFDYQNKNRTIQPDPYSDDGKKLDQLKVLDYAPKPTIYSEGTKLTTYLRNLHGKMTNVDIQYELNLHLKHPKSSLKTYKEHLNSLSTSLEFLKAHSQPINLKT